MGLEQIWQLAIEVWPGCLRQGWPSALSSPAPARAADAWCVAKPRRGGCGTAVPKVPAGVAIEPVTDTGAPIGLALWPSWRRTRPSTKSDASVPQAGQINCTGRADISGVISNSYFAPQEHCTFITYDRATAPSPHPLGRGKGEGRPNFQGRISCRVPGRFASIVFNSYGGQGFSSISPGLSSSGIPVLGELNSTCPSQNRKLPPNCR